MREADSGGFRADPESLNQGQGFSLLHQEKCQHDSYYLNAHTMACRRKCWAKSGNGKLAVGRNLKKVPVSTNFQIVSLSDSLTLWTMTGIIISTDLFLPYPPLRQRTNFLLDPRRKSSARNERNCPLLFITPSSQRTHSSLFHPTDSILKQCDLLIMEHRQSRRSSCVTHYTPAFYVSSENKGYLSL